MLRLLFKGPGLSDVTCCSVDFYLVGKQIVFVQWKRKALKYDTNQSGI